MADTFLNLTGVQRLWSKIKDYVDTALGLKLNTDAYATDSAYGIVKTNGLENITLNADGQLTVGGRLGQTVDGGLFFPVYADPVQVKRFSLVLSEAKRLSVAHRDFIIAGGNTITIKTAEAGATEYRVSNTQDNRFICACFKGGRLAIDEASAKEKTVAITSVKFANGDDVVPYFGATESDNDIVITVDESLNPDATLANIRGYGTWTSADIVSVGQGNSAGGGKTVQVGQACLTEHNNQVLQVGNHSYTTANNCYMLGSDLLNRFQYVFIAGQGHDTTNGRAGVAAVGRWSEITSDTLFVVGNGTNYATRSNAFEIKADGRVKASGTPIEADDLATKSYVDAGGGSVSFTTYGNADFTYASVIDAQTGEVVNECVAYSTVAGNANEPTAIKYGRIVSLSGAFKNVGERASNAPFDMGTVPPGCEPAKSQFILEQGSTQHKFLLTIRPDGTLNCSRYSTAGTNTAVTDGAWLNLNATYVSAS